MTMTINNQSVKKSVLNFAIRIARTRQTTVVIYGAEVGKGTQHLVSTLQEWNGCSNKDELAFVTKIDKEGNFID